MWRYIVGGILAVVSICIGTLLAFGHIISKALDGEDEDYGPSEFDD